MLKPFLLGLLLFVPLSQAAQQQSPANPVEFTAGTWNATNTTPRDAMPKGDWPKGLHLEVSTTFVIYTDGKTFDGKAVVDTFPGEGVLKDGKIDGDNVSFTVITHPNINYQPVEETIYYSGKINGDEMDLVMRWRLAFSPKHPTLQLTMKAKKAHRD
jgi:hypothetical protein